MLAKAIGILIALVAVALLVLAVWAMFHAQEMAEMLAWATKGTEAAVDSADWESHWLLSSSIMLVTSAALIVGGLAMFFRRRWALVVLGGTALVFLAIDVISQITGYAKYDYEVSNRGQSVFLVACILATAVAYWRWSRPPAHRE